MCIRDRGWDLRPDVNILSGINGVGKTTILNRSVGYLEELSGEMKSDEKNGVRLFFDNPQATYIPVSYTHLDVYKRQIRQNADWARYGRIHISIVMIRKSCNPVSVSYTHLDVYKRQMETLDPKSPNHILVGVGGTGGKVLKAIRKRIYQDVYKRQILHSLIAGIYADYAVSNQWQLRQRTEIVDQTPATDMREWTANIDVYKRQE